jgi:hypothetical protein
MLRADPFFPALKIDLCGIFPSRRLVSIPRIIGIGPCLTVNRSPVARSGSGGNSFRVSPSDVVVLFFFDVVPDRPRNEHGFHGIGRRAFRHVLFFVFIILVRINGTFGIRNAGEPGRGRISTWTTTSRNTCRGNGLLIVLDRFEAAFYLNAPV